MSIKFQRKTVFIYEINGQEKLKITNPEEAKKWDEIFDIATQLDSVIGKKDMGFKISESDRGDLCIFLAQNKDELLNVLKSGAPPEPSPTASPQRRQEVPELKVPSSNDGFSL